MVEFELKIHEKQGTAYIPKEIRQALGHQLKASPNRAAVLLYPKNMPIQDVLKSVAIIKEDLEHGLRLEKGSSK